MQNISEGGAGIVPQSQLTTGEPYLFRIQIPEVTQPVRIVGEVTWQWASDTMTKTGIKWVYWRGAEVLGLLW